MRLAWNFSEVRFWFLKQQKIYVCRNIFQKKSLHEFKSDTSDQEFKSEFTWSHKFPVSVNRRMRRWNYNQAIETYPYYFISATGTFVKFDTIIHIRYEFFCYNLYFNSNFRKACCTLTFGGQCISQYLPIGVTAWTYIWCIWSWV